MRFRIKRKDELLGYIKRMFVLSKLEEDEVADCAEILEIFITDIQPNTYVGVEYPYVDKLYRDSHYSYYSSKLKEYQRNCIRLSFFSIPIRNEDFFSSERIEQIRESFLGYLIIRPTPPNIIGRNFFRPDAFSKKQDVYTTITVVYPTINGVKLSVSGFPHCSQDSEMMVCAETTIWSIVEYFSNRYSDYKSILPHEINQILSNKSVERQIPSLGLSAYHMSYVLKKLGFGVRMYSSGSYDVENIYKIISIYVESGIPVVTTMQNNFVAHVMNIIGRTEFFNDNHFRFSVVRKLSNGSYLYDFYEQHSRYLVIDDNLPPYSEISLKEPSANYADNPIWADCKIDAAIAPLHTDIYMEADRAERLVYSYLQMLSQEMELPSLVVRVFLTSCRSFKDFIVNHVTINRRVKQRIINIDMPKFVYVAELAYPQHVSNQEANGIIILDATEPKKANFIGSFIENKYLTVVDGHFKVEQLPLQPFKRFSNLQIFKQHA